MTTISDLSRSALALLLATSLALSAPLAFAEPTPADKETAREYMTQGRAARAKGDHEAALAAFKAAHAIMNVPTTGLELGMTQMDLGLLLEARETFLAAAKHPEAPNEPPKFALSRVEAKKIADGLSVRIPSVQVTFTGVANVHGLTLTIDDRDVPVVGLSVMRKVNPGKHLVVARVDARERRETIELKEGETRELTLDLTAVEAPKVVAPPKKVEVKPTTSPLVYVGFGVAGAGLIAGGITGLIAMSRASSVREQCVDGKCPPSTHDDYDSGKTVGNISTALFVVAGVGAVIGVIGLLSKPKIKEGPTVSLYFGPLSTGLVGSF